MGLVAVAYASGLLEHALQLVLGLWSWAVAAPRAMVGMLAHTVDVVEGGLAAIVWRSLARPAGRRLRSQGMQTDGCVPEAHEREFRQRRRSRAAAVDRLLEELLPEILQACRAMSRRAELEHAAREQADLMTRTLGEQNRAMIEDLLQTCAAAREASAAARLSIQDLASKVDGIDRRLSDAPPVEPASESKYQSAADRQRHSSVQNNDAASEEIGALDMLRELDRRLPPLPVHTASVRSHRPSIRQEIKRRSWFGRQPA